jgi:phosphoserine phosphatase
VNANPDGLLSQIEAATLKAMNCERVTIFVHNPVTHELSSQQATGDDAIRISIEHGVAGCSVRTRRTVNVPDARRDPRFCPDVDLRTGFRTRNLLSVPLRGPDGAVMGALEMVNRRQGAFSDADEELATALGALAGMVLQGRALLEAQARRQHLERELDVAKRIQRSLLPQEDPAIDGFDVSGWNLPAEATGGDFYDHFLLANGHQALVLADVAGHGLGSSLLACECRALVRANAAVSSDVAEILARTNAFLHSDLHDERFVTMFLASLDPDTSQLTYVSAGHPSLLHCGQTAAPCCRALDSTTLPLGILPDLHIEPETLRLRSGETLLLLTDGFYEWANEADEPFGEERIMEVVRRHHEEPASGIIARLWDSVRRFASTTSQGDDLTALVIKRL